MDKVSAQLLDFKKRLHGLFREEESFEFLALDIFKFQSEQNPVYKEFISRIGGKPEKVKSLEEISFLPISFFKSHTIKSGNWTAEKVFLSSGTTGSIRSQHNVFSVDDYDFVSQQIFRELGVSLKQSVLLGLLPTYLENPNSSLVHMVESFGKITGDSIRFFHLDFTSLESVISDVLALGKTPVLFSVTYALLKMAEESPFDLGNCLVVETGGMKGLKKEMCKQEILDVLKEKLNIKQLVSEYGMTEMLSQAYAHSLEYQCGKSLKVLVRDPSDPIGSVRSDGRGVLNLIDLANFATCSFIASEDLGQVHCNGKFEIFGRLEQTEVRGCNLLFG